MNFWKQLIASDRRAIRWYNIDKIVQEFSYLEVIAAAQKIEVILQSLHKSTGLKFLAIVISHSASIVPVIIACLNCSTTFGCINPNGNLQDIVESAHRFRADLLVVDENDVNYDGFIECTQIEILGKKLKFIWYMPVGKRQASDDVELMFLASTSGSTGQPKVIGVTFSSFMSNISGLSRIYHLTSSDLIYVSSPPTFDPFILDICLALSCGATIVMACNEVRLDAKHLLYSLFPPNGSGISIMQITPSLFQRWNDHEIKTVIFAPDSSLRCLIFGGEPAPCVTDLKRWRDWSEGQVTKQRIFNIYGCTEQSCWTSIHEISHQDILAGSIPLGVTIDTMDTLVIKDVETGNELSGDGVGELYLTGRFCHRFGKNDSSCAAVQTGDIVERVGSAIYFHSRLDDVVKLYGTKIQLRTIEKNAKLVKNVLEACCVFDKPSQTLILFLVLRDVIADAVSSVLRRVRAEQQEQHVDYIKILPHLPLSYHGKVSRSKLLELHRKQMLSLCLKTPSDFCMEQLNLMLQMNIKTDRTNEKEMIFNEEERSWLEISFRQAGGTSFMALNLLTALETAFNKPFSNFMGMLLDERQALKGVFKYLKESNNHNDVKDPISKNQKTVSLTPVWQCNLDKCVDATPTVCNLPGFGVIISCGSHSRRLINVRGTDGHMISELRLPDRIESQVTQHQDILGLVGCYDGILYCFELRTGTVRWHFDSGDMIKCRAVVVQHTIVFGNYGSGHNLWGLCAETGALRWSSRIGQNSIYANPCRMGDTNTVLICTLDGTYARICCDSGKLEWIRKMKTPIFSSPRLLFDWDRIVLAEVAGTVHCIDFEGVTLWEYTVGGNVFSSFEIIGGNDENCDVASVIFGCYDRYVYCLHVNKHRKNEYSLAWRCSLDGQIFATPILWKEDFVLVCSTNGQMATIRWRNGIMIGTYNVNGEIFSSPAVCDLGRAFVGCRNNNLYCFRMSYD